MKKILYLFLMTTNLLALGLAQLGTTDENESLVIRQLMDLLMNDTCQDIVQDIGYFCCASQPILGVFERMMGLKSISLCQIHQTLCMTRNCETEEPGLSCGPNSCPPPTDEEMKIEEMIQNQSYSDQQILEMLLPDILINAGLINQHAQSQDNNEVRRKRQTLKSIASTILNKRKNF